MENRAIEPVASIVRAMHDEVVQQFELTKRISHPGESGRAREQIIQRFLRRFVPEGLGIDTGFVVDSAGGISRQVDIVIYRNSYHPVLEIGGLKHFLVESVVAAIETKARVGDRRTLRNALENVRSVKKLDKSASGQNYTVVDFNSRGVAIDRPETRVWTAIIAEQSVSRQTFLDEIQEDMLSNDMSLWLNCYASIHEFASHFVNRETKQLAYYPDSATALVLTDPTRQGCEKPLVDFAFLLADQLRHAAVVDYSPSRYLPMSRSFRDAIDIPRDSTSGNTGDSSPT